MEESEISMLRNINSKQLPQIKPWSFLPFDENYEDFFYIGASLSIVSNDESIMYGSKSSRLVFVGIDFYFRRDYEDSSSLSLGELSPEVTVGRRRSTGRSNSVEYLSIISSLSKSVYSSCCFSLLAFSIAWFSKTIVALALENVINCYGFSLEKRALSSGMPTWCK